MTVSTGPERPACPKSNILPISKLPKRPEGVPPAPAEPLPKGGTLLHGGQRGTVETMPKLLSDAKRLVLGP